MKSVADLRLALAVSSVLIPASFAGAQTYILAANSTADAVHLFDPTTGAVLDRFFIYEPRMSIAFEPLKIGNEIWVCDQGASSAAFWRFTQDGMPLGKIDITATHGTQLGTRGMALVPRPGGSEVWVSQAGNSSTSTPGRLLRYSLTGQPLGTFNTASDSFSPWDVFVRGNEVYVGDSQTDDVDRYDFNGNFLGKFVDSSGGGTSFPLNAPEQIAQMPDGRIIVASRTAPSDIHIFDDSVPRDVPQFPNTTIYERLSSRGVIGLTNGDKFIYSRGDGFYLQDINPTVTETALFKEAGFESARYMNRETLTQSPRDPAAVWAADVSGDWSTAARWANNDAPLSVPESAVFGSAIQSPRQVTLNEAATVLEVTFDNASAYTVAGTGSIRFSGNIPKAVRVVRGNHEIGVPVTADRLIRFEIDATTANNVTTVHSLSLTAGLDTGVNDVYKLGFGKLAVDRIRAGLLAVGQGEVALTGTGAPGTSSRLTGLVVEAFQDFDIGLSDVIIDGGETPMSMATLRSYCSVGRIYSLVKPATIRPGYATAAALGVTMWDGEAVSPTAAIVRRTLPGDATLDRVVNFDDLLKLAANYNGTGKFWYEGDFTYNGVVNFDDLLLLAANYNQTLTGDFAGDWALAQSLVPEPATLTMLAGVAAGMLRRRRRTA